VCLVTLRVAEFRLVAFRTQAIIRRDDSIPRGASDLWMARGMLGRASGGRPLVAAAFATLLAACGGENRYVAPPPPQVKVALPIEQNVTRYLEATGTTAAVNSANLVARVQGFLQEIRYRDGDEVKQGAVLFVIEPEPYKLKLEQARAAEAGAAATLKQNEAEYERQADLAGRAVAAGILVSAATSLRLKVARSRVKARITASPLARPPISSRR